MIVLGEWRNDAPPPRTHTCFYSLPSPCHLFKGIYSDLSLCFWVPDLTPGSPQLPCLHCAIVCYSTLVVWPPGCPHWELGMQSRYLFCSSQCKEAWGMPQRRLSNCWSWQFCYFERQQNSGKEENFTPLELLCLALETIVMKNILGGIVWTRSSAALLGIGFLKKQKHRHKNSPLNSDQLNNNYSLFFPPH